MRLEMYPADSSRDSFYAISWQMTRLENERERERERETILGCRKYAVERTWLTCETASRNRAEYIWQIRGLLVSGICIYRIAPRLRPVPLRPGLSAADRGRRGFQHWLRGCFVTIHERLSRNTSAIHEISRSLSRS